MGVGVGVAVRVGMGVGIESTTMTAMKPTMTITMKIITNTPTTTTMTAATTTTTTTSDRQGLAKLCWAQLGLCPASPGMVLQDFAGLSWALARLRNSTSLSIYLSICWHSY